MIETILKWLGAGDSLITTMGPTVAIILAMLGGFGITQVLKFPIAKLIDDGWRDWSIRVLGIVSTWGCAHWLGNLSTAVELIVAVSQPLGYKAAMGVIRHFWPWLEAGKLVGSAAPSDAAVQLRSQRQQN